MSILRRETNAIIRRGIFSRGGTRPSSSRKTHIFWKSAAMVLNPVRAGLVEQSKDWAWSSYRATAGKEPPHPCLTKDWILGQFGSTTGAAEKEYRQFVKWGIGQKSIWNEVKGQTILGEDEFVESLADHLKKHKDIPEIPKSQRYANRPPLEKIFNERILCNKRKRDRNISEAVEKYGYTQRAIADHLGVHFTYVSRILKERGDS